MAIQIIQKLKDRVALMLQVHPSLRDSDSRLIANMWHEELPANIRNDPKVIQFLKLIADGKMTNPESIRRIRQKLQQHNVQLRGTNQNSKHANQATVRTALGYNN